MLSDNQEEKHKDRWIEDKNEISQKFLEIFEEMKESSNVWKIPTSHISVSFQFPGVACGLRLIKAKKKLCCFRDTRMSS